MKKKLFLSALFVGLVISMGAAPRGFWQLYISGPDTRCDMDSRTSGTWTIEDTYGDPVDPNNQYEWFINDYEAQQEGYPAWSFGRSTGMTTRSLTTSFSWGDGGSELDQVTLTCKITSNGETRYEGLVISNCY